MPACAKRASSASRDVARAVDAQRERRALRCRRRGSIRQCCGPVRAHARDPPARMRPAADRLASRALEQRLALAQEPAQQRVDERLRRRPRDLRRGGDRVIDDGERRRVRVLELIERDRDERRELAVGDRLVRERADQRVERALVPQRAVGELLHERSRRARVVGARRLERRRKRLAVEHAADSEGGLLLRLLQRRRSSRCVRRAREAARRAPRSKDAC